MLFVSDVHGAAAPLAKVVGLEETLVILGDLINLSDYRTGEGAVADVLGIEQARASGEARARGDYQAMRAIWLEAAGDDPDRARAAIMDVYRRQYDEVIGSLEGGEGLVIHGNVDRPSMITERLPHGFRFAHGQVVELEGLTLGLVGGGVVTPLQAEGEIDDEEMTGLLESLGPVDVLCTHIPPAIGSLRRDVVAGRDERGSAPVLEYLLRYQPRYHLYGDIHQARATTWRVGRTRCANAGYFRATGRYLRLDAAGLHTGRVG